MVSFELQALQQAVLVAGAAVLQIQRSDITISRKSNRDIVTQADLLANDILKEQLLAHWPQAGWLSEESVDDAARLQKKQVWIIDPIDGTKEYAQGIPEYALSAALVEQGVVLLAAVFNPAKNELFLAERGVGAWLGAERIHCRSTNQNRFSLLASRSEFDRGEWAAFQQHDVQVVGSIAYKLALVAAGKADATFSLGPKNEWDIAAGVLLVQEAGGIVTNQNGLPFIFNSKKVLVDGIVASAANINKEIFAMIAAVA